MSREALRRYIGQQELGRGFEAPNVVYVSFTGPQRARFERAGIVGISGAIGSSEVIRAIRPSEIVESSKKDRPYNPRARVEKVFDRQGRLVRRSRGSRCHRPGHEPSSCHRGTGCKAARRVKLIQSNLTVNNRPKIEKVIFSGFYKRDPFKNLKKAA